MLPGKLVLQVDEVVNIGVAVRERYSGNDGSSRCLKLLLTDGVCGCCCHGAAASTMCPWCMNLSLYACMLIHKPGQLLPSSTQRPTCLSAHTRHLP